MPACSGRSWRASVGWRAPQHVSTHLGGDRVADLAHTRSRLMWPAIAAPHNFQRTLDPQKGLCRPLIFFTYFSSFVGLLRYGSGLAQNVEIARPATFVPATIATVSPSPPDALRLQRRAT